MLTESTIPAYITQVLTGQQAKETDPLRDSDGSGSNASNPYNARIGVLRELHTKKSDRYVSSQPSQASLLASLAIVQGANTERSCCCRSTSSGL